MLEFAGKRASLSDLSRRLLAIPGVRDGVVFQLTDGDALGVHRIAALAVAPGLDEHAILDALRLAIDPLSGRADPDLSPEERAELQSRFKSYPQAGEGSALLPPAAPANNRTGE